MGLRSDIQTDMAEAFDGDLADAVATFTASRVTTSGTLDPVTGDYPTTTTAYSGRGIFANYEAREVDGQHILATDTKLIALQNEVVRDSDGSQYAPAVDDTLAGYRVVNVGKDPAGAIWEVQLRRS